MFPKINKRRHHFNEAEKQHLKLKDLKEILFESGLKNDYLVKENIPPYPHPEFHVCRLKHDTDEKGLRGIRKDEGFRNPDKGSRNPDEDSLLWWSLDMGPEEITSAERKLLETNYPDLTEEEKTQREGSFLGKFATSPAIKRTSRMGSYRFTFPLEEVLKAYSEQICSGESPVMRMYATHLYKQQVMYVVLVHSPANQKMFSEYPWLTDDPKAVCAYKDGCFIWRSEAMCETHNYELVLRRDEKQMAAEPVSNLPQYYMWDHVAVALHVDDQVLNFDVDRLRENLKFCQAEKPGLINDVTFEAFPKAEKAVKGLWPDNPSPLEKE